jgi:hypothetical protein
MTPFSLSRFALLALVFYGFWLFLLGAFMYGILLILTGTLILYFVNNYD